MRCNYTKPNNKQCLANAMKDSKFCFTHNPKMKEQKLAAVIRGGKSSKKNCNRLPAVPLNDPKDVVALLSRTINEARTGSIELRVANCIGYLSGHLIKAIEISNLEERISKIEDNLNKKETTL